MKVTKAPLFWNRKCANVPSRRLTSKANRLKWNDPSNVFPTLRYVPRTRILRKLPWAYIVKVRQWSRPDRIDVREIVLFRSA